jgi:hypothetical protein
MNIQMFPEERKMNRPTIVAHTIGPIVDVIEPRRLFWSTNKYISSLIYKCQYEYIQLILPELISVTCATFITTFRFIYLLTYLLLYLLTI